MREDPKFGTDGVRGLANADLSAFFAFRLGRAAGFLISSGVRGQKILVGQDTRISADLLRCGLVSGLLSVGTHAVDLGVLPTAAVAYLTQHTAAAAGAMISASHNPMPDNGIKFFGPNGRKIADELETEIEVHLDRFEDLPSPTRADVGRLLPAEGLVQAYVEHLQNTMPISLGGLRLVMDCAYGAASALGPRVAEAAGAAAYPLCHQPDGTNINAGCGALHPEVLQQAARKHGADLGVSFDGDADRAIFADECGRLVDGDRVLAMCAIAWKDSPLLPGNRVVGTVMSNLGLEVGLARHGIELLRAPVGDRHVADLMLSSGAALGGEKSGHIIFHQHATTGDGILTLLQVAGLMVRTGRRLSELASQVEEFPQRLVNVPVWRRRGWREQPDLWRAVRRGEERLGGRGRILVRASGTERMIRVMAEGPDAAEIAEIVDEIAAVIRERMGAPPSGQPR
ncbi:MAG: phosphoglucosamine mutase [Armatimonadetes bacterium]|nr:phosphoglucosamine mutase [Armatimonadota bacterium]